MFYSKETGGFYTSDQSKPDDAVEIDDAHYVALMDGNANGMEIVADDLGQPVLAQSPSVDLFAYANAKQWELATGGYTVPVNGVVPLAFATDPISQTMIIGKALRLQQPDAPVSIRWQFAAGYEEISAADFIAASIKIADFVQATFDALQPVLADIGSGGITTTADIDAAVWPENHA